MKSNYVAYKLARWFGITSVLASIHLFFMALASIDIGSNAVGNLSPIRLLLIVILGILGFLAYNNFVYLQTDDEGVLIIRKEKKKLLLWKDVKSAFRIFGASPPLYGMRFQNSKTICFFGMRSKLQWYIETPWMIIGGDSSGVVNYVQERTM